MADSRQPFSKLYIDHGDVWRRSRPEDPSPVHVCDGSGMLGIAYDPEEGTVWKHGELSAVTAWMERNDEKNRVVPVHLRFPVALIGFPVHAATVAELELCVSGRTDRVLALPETFARLAAEHPDIRVSPWAAHQHGISPSSPSDDGAALVADETARRP